MPYVLRQLLKEASFMNAADNGFTVGTYEDLIPTADLVCNLTPDKQHTAVVTGYNAFDEGRLSLGLLSQF
jgi:ketol-acid reductoisomerase